MKIKVSIDFEDGVPEQTRHVHVPHREHEGVVIQPTPDILWYYLIKTGRDVLRHWAWEKNKRSTKMREWRPLSDEWEAPIGFMIRAAWEKNARDHGHNPAPKDAPMPSYGPTKEDRL